MKKLDPYNYYGRKYLPFSLTFVQGAIGKEYVIKHYRYGAVKTKFPDMTRIIASAGQRKCRNLFKEAVAYAKTVIADPVKKAAWEKKVKIKYRVFNRVIKEYMLAAKEAIMQREKIGTAIIRKCFVRVYYSAGNVCMKLVRRLYDGNRVYLETG